MCFVLGSKIGRGEGYVKKEDLIFQVHRVVRTIEEATGLGELDASSRSVLNFIGEAEVEERALNVSSVVKARIFGTPPTVYARLTALEKAGWIEFKSDPHDGRAKQVHLTRAARRSYIRMSRAIQKLLLPE
jgi:DNA-binding MarR family transcriptional regulator